MRYFVYVLLSTKTRKTYVGSTTNFNRRLFEHNEGKSYYTKRYAPWKLIYKEGFENVLDAKKREKYLKSRSGRKLVLKKLFKN